MANKPKSQKPTDESMARMDEAWKIAEEAAETKYKTLISDLQQKIKDTPFRVEFATKIKAKDSEESMARFQRVLFLRQAKEALKKEGMWTRFCQENGIDIKNAEYEIGKLWEFKDDLLLKFGSFVGYDLNKIKYLGDANSEKLGVVIDISQSTVVYNGEEIPFTPEEIQAVLERQDEIYKAQIEEKDAALRTKNKLIESKDDLIHRQGKTLSKFEKEAARQGLTLEEDAFIKKVENLRIGFDGYMISLDPDRMEDLVRKNNPTARMVSAYVSALKYMKMQICSAHDTAIDTYADPSMFPDEGWQPPADAKAPIYSKSRYNKAEA